LRDVVTLRPADLAFRAMGTDIRLIGHDVSRARRWLAGFEQTLSHFRPDSELSRLNADSRPVVPASHLLRTAIAAALWAARLTRGLVVPALGPWQEVIVLEDAISRPPGLRFDLGGSAKGLAADRLATAIRGTADCGGDIRVVGSRIVESDHGAYRIADGAIATSGTDRRGHHIFDPRTGRPARLRHTTATALAPTALEAEARAKAALISGDDAWLVHGGRLA
jgi:thiamine biosynthesis lipoprotein